MTIQMVVPKSAMERFKRKAREIFPDDADDAPSLLLSIFIEYMGKPDNWCLFIPDLPVSAKNKWQKLADQTYDQLYEVARNIGTSGFGPLRELLEGCLQMRRMDVADLVKLILMTIETGNVSWQKSNDGIRS